MTTSVKITNQEAPAKLNLPWLLPQQDDGVTSTKLAKNIFH